MISLALTTHCLIRPFLRGPRQMTASSGLGSMKPMDMTPRFSCRQRGTQKAVAAQVRKYKGRMKAMACRPASAAHSCTQHKLPSYCRTCTYTGLHPVPLWWISSPSRPSILGTEGPQMSMSNSPTCAVGHGEKESRCWHGCLGTGICRSPCPKGQPARERIGQAERAHCCGRACSCAALA